MSIRFLVTIATLCLLYLSRPVLSQNVFPLPSREERLVAEAGDAKTPVPQLLEMLRAGSAAVKAAAFQALLQRKPWFTLKEIQASAKQGDEGNLEIHRLIAMLQKVPATTNQETEELSLILRRKAYSDSQYSVRLLRFAHLVDIHALPLMEDYLSFIPHGENNPISDDRETINNRVKLQNIYWDMKWRRFNLKQKIDYFVTWGRSCDSLRQNKQPQVKIPLIAGIASAIAKEKNAVVSPLKEIAMNEKESTCLFENTINALYEINTPQSVAALLFISQSGNKENRELARQFLLSLGDRHTAQEELPLFLKRLASQDPASNQMNGLLWEAEKLSKSGVDRSALENAFLPFLKHGNIAAVMLIRSFGSEKSVDALIDLINTNSMPNSYQQDIVKTASVTTLAVVGRSVPEKTLPVLLGVSSNNDPAFRIVGAQAIAHLKNPLALPVMMEFAEKEKDSKALLYQVSAIYFIGGSDAMKYLSKLRDYGKDNGKPYLQELSEEGLLRLEQENRGK